MIQVTRRGRPHHGERQEGKPGCTSSRISDDKSVHAREVREVRDAKNNEAHGARIKSTTFVRAGESVSRRVFVSAQCLTFADAAEVRETMNKSSHVCARVRVGEYPVSP